MQGNAAGGGGGTWIPHATSLRGPESCPSILPPWIQLSGLQDGDDPAPLGACVLLQADDDNISPAPAKPEPRRGSALSRPALSRGNGAGVQKSRATNAQFLLMDRGAARAPQPGAQALSQEETGSHLTVARLRGALRCR